MLSLRDYRNYRQNRASHTDNDFPLLRSKIRELHPVHRASLKALLLHLLLVSSRSDMNAMTVKALADKFCYAVLRGNEVLHDGVHLKKLVVEDLIQNADTLFDELPSPSQPVPSSDVVETASLIYGSFWSRESLTEEVEVAVLDQVVPEVRHTEAVETLTNSTPPAVSPMSVAEWRLDVSQSRIVPPHPEAMTIPQSPSESVLSSTSGFPLSSATSLRTRMGPFSP